jgi:mRNA interferase MazF
MFMMSIKRGHVVRVLFPNSDLTSSKRRPALVVQADKLETGLAQTIVAMITSNMGRASHPSRITVLKDSPESIRAGLRLNSVVMTDNLVTVANTEIDSILGSLPMPQVDTALRHTLGL